MTRSNRFVLCAMCLLAVCFVAATSLAESPFNGTWKTDMSQTKWSPKPLIFYISQGWYHCVTCNPAWDVAADGQDHPVAGQSYDTVAIMISDDHTIAETTKKNGKIVFEQTRTVSGDGKTLTVHTVDHPKDSDKTLTFDTKAKRDGMPHPGVHATSGRWVIEQQKGSEDAMLTTYKVDGDQITMTSPDGETYTATFGGGDAPAKGAYGYNAVSLRRIDPHSIEETDKRDGRVIDVTTLTVSPNGKMLTAVDHDQVTGRTSTYIAKKQ
jgi:hypothetical protein